MPFPVRALSVDNGSEFMAEFEATCAERGIACSPAARSPKLNGTVERANRTHTEEFYEVTDAEPDLASLQVACSTGRRRTTRRPLASGGGIPHTPRTMQITTVAWLMCMRRRPRRVEDGVLGA